MHALAMWLERHWSLLAICGVQVLIGWRAARERTKAAWEYRGRDWPAVEGRAICWVCPAGLSGFRLHVRGVVGSDHPDGELSHKFVTKDEAKYYARALRGQTVQVHTNPAKAKESTLRWVEMESLVAPYVSPTQGRLTAAGYRGAQVFSGVALGGMALALADVALFAAKPDFAWRGLCMCDLSLLLLLAGILLLAPARVLTVRMQAIGVDSVRGASRRVMASLIAVGLVGFLGLGLLASVVGDSVQDKIVYAAITAPMLALMYWAGAVGLTAVRELQPIAQDMGSEGVVNSGGELAFAARPDEGILLGDARRREPAV